MLSLAVEFSVFQTHLRRLGTRQTIFGVPCSPIFFLFFGQVDTSKGNSYHVWESEKNLKSCCLVNSSVLTLMNMFGIGQCKTRTTDYCFSTCKWERDNNSPTFSHLKPQSAFETAPFGILRTSVCFYHAWWHTNKIRSIFPTKTESEKINWFHEGTLTFSFPWNVPLSNG